MLIILIPSFVHIFEFFRSISNWKYKTKPNCFQLKCCNLRYIEPVCMRVAHLNRCDFLCCAYNKIAKYSLSSITFGRFFTEHNDIMLERIWKSEKIKQKSITGLGELQFNQTVRFGRTQKERNKIAYGWMNITHFSDARLISSFTIIPFGTFIGQKASTTDFDENVFAGRMRESSVYMHRYIRHNKHVNFDEH